VTVLRPSPALNVPSSLPVRLARGVLTSRIIVTCPPPVSFPVKNTMSGTPLTVVSLISDRVPVKTAPPLSEKLSVPPLVKSPGLPETPVNAKGPPDKVTEVAPAKTPEPSEAKPPTDPVSVIVRLALFPEKVAVAVVGNDKFTTESDALAVIALSAIASIMTAGIKNAFRMLDTPVRSL